MSTLKSLVPQAFAVSDVHPRLRKHLSRCTLDCGFKTPESPALRGFVAERCPITGTSLYLAFFFVLEKGSKSAGNAVIPTFPMHRSYGLHGSLKRRCKHPSPTSINGYHTAKKLLSQSPAKRPTFAFADESGLHTRLCQQDRTQRLTRRNRGCFGWGRYYYPRSVLRGSETLRGQVSERRTLPLWDLGREVLSKNAENLRDSDALMRVAVPKASRPRWAA